MNEIADIHFLHFQPFGY